MKRPLFEQRLGGLEYQKPTSEDIIKLRSIIENCGQGNSGEGWIGDPKWYPIIAKIEKPLICGRFSLVPVRYDRTAHNDEWNKLFLIDSHQKSLIQVANSGVRRIHYNGYLKFIPEAVEFKRDEGKVLISYTEKVRPYLKDLLKEDFWTFYAVNKPHFYSDKRIREFAFPFPVNGEVRK